MPQKGHVYDMLGRDADFYRDLFSSLDNIALNEPDLPDKTRTHLEQIGESAQHLLALINDILDMSRIESGRMVLKSEEFSIGRMLEQVNAMIGGQCRDKGLNYDCVVHGKLDEFYIGDDTKLKQVLINILGNAVKFTPEGGNITFEIEKTAAYDGKSVLRFLIRDTGVGMDEDYMPKLFQPFSQEDATSTNKFGGTGLGLAITKHIVELMNGEIIGDETAIIILTAYSWDDVIEEALAAGVDSFIAKPLFSGSVVTEFSAALRKKGMTGERKRVASLSGKRALLAEDVEINAMIMEQLLAMKGMTVELAENGQEAVDMYREHPEGYYDAILMDIRMPLMDGLEATEAIRASDRGDSREVPIVALTANAFDEDVQRSLQAGMNAHLSKPIEPDRLYQILSELIRE